MIRCTECKEWKSEKEFPENKKKRSGLKSSCKACNRERARAYRHTKEGLITTIYSNQKQNSKNRVKDCSPPNYTRQELLQKALSSQIFNRLYDEWVVSGYRKELTPSFDRERDDEGYSFNNLNRWMTWKENNQKGNRDIRNNKLKHGPNPQKAIIGIHIITGEVIEFHSACEAKRQTGINNKNISSCCLNRKRFKSAGGYKWKFKE